MSVSQHKLESFIRQRRFGAVTLLKLKKQGERLLITNLIGTLFVTSAPMIIAEKYITPEIARTFSLSGDIASIVVFLIAFMIVLLIGEISAKILGVRFNDSVALAVAPIYQVLIWLLLPLTVVVEWCVRILTWIAGGKLEMHGSAMSEEELDAFIDLSRDTGAVEATEHRQIR